MPAFAHIAAATLFNSLWESALLALVVGLALRLLPNVSATTRYFAWSVALAASVLLPLATAVPQIAVQRAAQQQQSAPLQVHSFENVTTTSAVVPHRAPAKPQPAALTPAPAPSFRLPSRLHFTLPEYAAYAIAGVWALVALLLLVRLAVNLWKLERLKSDALPLPVEYRERLERWANADKGEREVRLCTCDGIEVPVAVGLFDSMILIPNHLLETLSQTEVDQIILHELAHLRRADDWTNGVQRVIQALFFFNPAVLYIAQQLDLEREVACDDWVVHQTKEVRPYATCLTKMAEATAWPHRPLAAPGVFITRRGLSVRVERLLRAGRNIRTSISFGPAGAVAASLIVLFFLLQTVAPSFAFTISSPQVKQQIASTLQKSVAKTHAPKKTIAASPKPQVRYITVPEVNVHIPERKITLPAVNVHVNGQRIAMPSVPPVRPLPPDFSKHMAQLSTTISQTVNATVSASMAQAFGGKGNFDCTGCDYSKQNLAGKSFRGKRLAGSDFSKANLRNADFSNTVLVGIDFSGADLSGASFAKARLTGCDFSHAVLAGADFTGVQMTGCDISASQLSPGQGRSVLEACGSGCDLSGLDLRNQSLRGLNLSGVDLERADFRGADLSGSTFHAVDFDHANFSGARLDNVTFVNCGFDGVDQSDLLSRHARIINGTGDGSM